MDKLEIAVLCIATFSNISYKAYRKRKESKSDAQQLSALTLTRQNYTTNHHNLFEQHP